MVIDDTGYSSRVLLSIEHSSSTSSLPAEKWVEIIPGKMIYDVDITFIFSNEILSLQNTKQLGLKLEVSTKYNGIELDRFYAFVVLILIQVSFL